MKVWITKYALTKGIYEREVEQTHIASMVSGPGTFEIYHGEGKNWHRTRGGAIIHANAIRLAKIKTLHKQLAKLQVEFK